MKAHADLAGFELMVPGSLNEPKIMLGRGSLPPVGEQAELEACLLLTKCFKIRD